MSETATCENWCVGNFGLPSKDADIHVSQLERDSKPKFGNASCILFKELSLVQGGDAEIFRLSKPGYSSQTVW